MMTTMICERGISTVINVSEVDACMGSVPG